MSPQMLTQSLLASCEPCPAGTFSRKGGTVQGGTIAIGNHCGVCPAGTFSEAGSTECNACRAGTVAPQVGAQSCYTCGEGLYASADPTLCVACPNGANCTKGRLQPLAGFWADPRRANQSSSVLSSRGTGDEALFLACPPQYCCSGDSCNFSNMCPNHRNPLTPLCGDCMYVKMQE